MATLTLEHLKTSKFLSSIKGPVSYSIADIFIRYDDLLTVDFDIMLDSGIPLQRPQVWTLEQKQELIKSILFEQFVPPISMIIYKSEPGQGAKTIETYKIVDGKQRLLACKQFINNEFSIEINGESFYFKDFDKMATYRLIYSFSFDCKVYYEYDDCRLSDAQLIEWFEFVNFSGTPQEASHLNNLKKSITK
ncbi:hypothetical protein MA9V1_228 [Chryseobacterium phage MA9V-1]|nr:hypothetical protein MA9V1_228 [Chryseobacterium phage MA9V-1]